jgi:hypothetical protein
MSLKSKKFLAYLLAEFTWKAVLIIFLEASEGQFDSVGRWAWFFMMSVVVTAGFVEVGYIGGQAWLDRYVRVAEIMRGQPKEAKQAPDENL